MCKASLWAKHHVSARAGATYDIGTSEHGLPALHPVGENPKECITCVSDRTVLTFSNIPIKLQQQYGLGSTATVMFVDTGDNQHDMLDIGGRKVMLSDFADCGVSAYVGVKGDAIADEDNSGAVVQAREKVTV